MPTKTTQPDQKTKLVASVAADQLGIKAVTLRKYSTMIEKQLNNEDLFRSSGTSHRLYTAADLAAFKDAITLTEQGATLAEALQQSFTPTTPAAKVIAIKADKSAAKTQSKPDVKLIKPAEPANVALIEQQRLTQRLTRLSQRLDQLATQAEQLKADQQSLVRHIQAQRKALTVGTIITGLLVGVLTLMTFKSHHHA